MSNITAEDLRRMAEERRRELGLSPSAPATPPVVAAGSTSDQRVVVQAECRECGEIFEAQGFVVLARVLGVPERCPDCRTAHEAEERERAEAERRERAERIRTERVERILDLMHYAGANPWEHGHCTFANFDPSESGLRPVEAVREWLDEVRRAGRYDQVRGLYLVGPTGCGKTHLAVAALRELLADPAVPVDAVVFDHALSLVTRIQDTYSTGESTEAILERRIRARVWILDDLGAERPSDDVVRRLTMICAERAGRPTLVTSNLTPDALEQRHPEFFRLASRLGPAYFRVVQVQGRDRRFDRPRRAS